MLVARNLKLLSLHNFCTDFRLYAPVAILYFAQVTGSYALGMSVFSITMLASALLEVPTGIFSDLIGRRKTLILGSVAAVLYSISYAIGGSYGWLVVGAVLEGLSRALYSGNNDALLHDSLTEVNRRHHFADQLGKTSAMFQVALALSAVLGGILAHWSFAWVMWLSIIPQLVGLGISFFVIEPHIHLKESGNIYDHLSESLKLVWKKPRLRWISIAAMLRNGFGEAAFQFEAAFHQLLWPVWALGLQKLASNGLAAISFWYSGKAIAKFKPLPILIIGNTYSRIVISIAVLFPTVFSPLLIASPSLIYGVGIVARNTLMHEDFTDKQRATMGSITSFMTSIWFAVVSVILGWVADQYGPAMTLLVVQVCQLSVIGIYGYLWKQERGR